MVSADPTIAPAALPPCWDGRWLDGRSAAPCRVRFRFDAGDLVVEGDDGTPLERAPLRAVGVAEPLAHAPRLFDLPGGGVLQAEETPALAAALHAAGHRESPVVSWQRAWPAALVGVVLLAGALVWAWRDGLPQVARWAAEHLSPELEARMGDQVLATLDRRMLQPSELPAARRAALTARFDAFRRDAGLDAVRRVEFRSIEGHGVNAFALPGGVVVFLDGIVEFAAGDDEMLLAVLAHEGMHQQHHDMTRGLFQALGYTALAGLVWGDYSSVASNGFVLVSQLHYTRGAEEEADEGAIEALRRAGISPAALARFFWKEDAEAKKKGREELDWLSTHPGSRDRAERAMDAAEEDRDEAASAPKR